MGVAIVPMLYLLWKGRGRYLVQAFIYFFLGKALEVCKRFIEQGILTDIIQFREGVGFGYSENAGYPTLLEILARLECRAKASTE